MADMRHPTPGFSVSVASKGFSGACPLEARGKRVASDEVAEKREQAFGVKGAPPPRVFFVRVANAGLMLDAASRITTKGHRRTMATGRAQAPDRIGINSSCATGTHPGCFVQRVRKNMKRNELWFCAVQKSA